MTSIGQLSLGPSRGPGAGRQRGGIVYIWPPREDPAQGDWYEPILKRLIVFDLEGVLTQQEFLLEVAKRADLLEPVLAEFHNGINGRTSWLESLERRMRILRGVPKSIFEEAAEAVTMDPAGAELTMRLKRSGWTVAIVTGGFDILERRVREGGVAYDRYLSHRLVFLDGALHGYELGYPDKGAAARRLREEVGADVTVAVGDGWNDVPMLKEADLAVGFRPKPAVREYVDLEVQDFGQLAEALNALGVL